MRRLVIAMLMAIFMLTSAFAYSNQQKIYSVDSGVYKAMETLCILSGKTLPSSSGPWSEAELQLMLAKIDRSSLPQAAQAHYDNLSRMISSKPDLQYDDSFAMDFGLELALEGYYHTNTEAFDDYNDWFHSYTDRQKFLNLTFETWPTKHFYGYFEYSVANCIGYDVGKGSVKNLMYSNAFNINLPIVNSILFSMPSNGDILADFDWTIPYRAFVATGGEHWSLMAGRDKLSWGAGETGNLLFSDSFPRHTLIRFNTFFNAFKYSIVGTVYPANASEESQFKSFDGFKAMIAHRLEFNIFKDKVGLILNEACMFWSTTTKDGQQSFMLAHVNPFGFMHNEYIAGNANSLLVFEANYTPVAGVNIYGQFAVDEFAGPGENRTNPSAFGFLAGVKGAIAAGPGIVTGGLEFAKTDPLLYLRGMYFNDTDRVGYGYDALFRTISCDRIILERMFTTYKYGNDVILFDAKARYEVAGKFNVGLEGMFMMHGSMNVNSPWGQYTGTYKNAPDMKTPTTYNVFNTTDYDPTTGTVLREHAVEKSFIVSLTGGYQILDNLSANAAVDTLIVQNKDNKAGNNQTDVQITLGVKYGL